MRSRIGVLAIAGVSLVTAVVFALMAGMLVGAHRSALLAQLTRGADQLSETIRSSTYWDMLENRREALHREIVTLGQQKGIEKVRLFNATGTIMFSSDESEIGRSLDKNAEACFACHAAGSPLQKLTTRERARIYRAPDGHRVLGMIRSIDNEPRCWNAACHAHGREERVLGVLDVNVSLAEADRQVAHDQRRLLLLGVLAVLASSVTLGWFSDRLVFRPVAALIAGTRKVAEGDFTTTLPVQEGNELGDLAVAFNDMTRKLSDARRQLTQADKLASVGRLAAGVAHEINNPLTGVLTYASFLQKRLADQPDVAPDLDVIVRETKRCREIVRGLLDFARQSPPQRRPTDINDVVRRSVAVVINQLTVDRVQLDLGLAPGLPELTADSNQLQQVAVNLILNAADAIGGTGGTIRVRTSMVELAPRGHAIVRVATCPRGCDLIDPNVRVGRYPGIRVLRRQGERDVVVHMDPVYGRVGHRADESSEVGTLAHYACPRCQLRLDLPGSLCADCGAPAFAVQTGEGERIEWCTRKGCHWTHWAAAESRGPQRHIEFAVEDSGHGIAPEDRDHLFEPFFTTKGNRGLGLGLAVTWGIVEGHGGTIDVTSEPGHGARFAVRLPLLPRVAPAGGEGPS